MARFNPNGSLDNSFGKGGEVTLYQGGGADQVVLQPDGKLIVRGANGIARLNSDGTPDGSFGDYGWIDEMKTARRIAGRGGSVSFTKLNLQSNGQILTMAVFSSQEEREGLALVRFDQNGQLDNSFGSGGLRKFVEGDYYAQVLPLLMDEGSVFFSYKKDGMEEEQTLYRANSDGLIDQSFASGEGVHFPSFISPVHPAADGKLLLHIDWDGTGERIVRLNADGSIDQPFTDAIAAAIGDDSWIHDFQIRPDGSVLVVGGWGLQLHEHGYGLKAFNSDGSLDQTFANNGFLAIDADWADRVTVYPDSGFAISLRLAIPSGCKHYCAESTDLLTERFNADGTADVSFGAFGMQPILPPMDSSVGEYSESYWRFRDDASDQNRQEEDADENEEDESSDDPLYVDPLFVDEADNTVEDLISNESDIWDSDSDPVFWDMDGSLY